jgi:predicted AlkP superfamily pyrophosphatase or phosphodiesterase
MFFKSMTIPSLPAMNKRLLSSLFCCLFCTTVSAQQKTLPRPRLVVGIVIDQMRWDYLYRYYDRFSDGGFRRLLSKGFSCEQAFLNYVPSYTAPGHASIFSGTVPAIHGIVGNDWVDRGTNQSVYCSEDRTVKAAGGSQRAGAMSPRNMKSNTVGDELRLATNFRSRVFGVALKDRGAIFPAGHLANRAYWFDDSTGNFISSDYYAPQLPEWVNDFNAKRWADTFCAAAWSTLYPIASYKQSGEDNNQYEELKAGETAPVFPHTPDARNYKSIRSLPAGNTLTFKFAKCLLKAEGLGRGEGTDMLTVSLSSTDYIGHAYGPNAIEVEDLYLRLDEELAKFLRYLDRHAGAEQYVVFLTADHGAAHNAAYLKDRGMPAGILSEYDMKRELNAAAKKRFGTDSLIRFVMNYQVALNDTVLNRKGVSREALKAFVLTQCKAYKGMFAVVALDDLAGTTLPGFLKEQIRNGFYAARCGDIGLIYEPAWYSDGPRGTTHGTWNPYDTHIPLLWYGWGISSGASFERVNVTDIAATLSALLRIQMPNGCSGSVILPVLKK